MKSILTRRAIEWEMFLKSILEERKRIGKDDGLKKTELERLILHNFAITKLKMDLINLEITEREIRWLKG